MQFRDDPRDDQIYYIIILWMISGDSHQLIQRHTDTKITKKSAN